MSLCVLHVLDHSLPLHSGYTFRTVEILKQQRAMGWTTHHLTTPKQEGASATEEEVDGIHFHRTIVPSRGLRAAPVIGQFSVIWDTRRRLQELIPKLRPDIIHAHSPSLNGIAALKVARQHGVPLVYEMRALWEDAAVDHGTTTEGSPRYKLSRGMETWILKRADAVTVICQGLYDDVLSRGIPASRITMIPNAVDVQRFPVIHEPDHALIQQLGLAGKTVLGFIGSFYGYEGLDVLLQAMPQILQTLPDVRVVLVGGGFEEDRLKAQAESLRIADKIIFTGRVPHADVNRYYSVIDLLVYPRKSMRLTNTVTPLKPLEAMAQGRMLAASDVGGHRELIADGQTGFLFKADSAASLAQCALRALQDQGQWERMRAAGRSFVELERTWERSVGRYRAAYSKVLGRSV
jgi:PEP-CTERM/exosortase A-associated glycosyltransferase